MNKEEENKLKKYIPPEKYGRNFPYSLRNCPGYEGYIPTNLTHEVCKYCGRIKYYH